ncbi:MAG: DNA mismatch repair protein MutS [Bacteriovoracaceae bacterium]|nr:DNA mismatch repair protein MutS [Bacteriovoracaceae bacterium]
MTDLQKIIELGIKLTPMIEQYVTIKKKYPDTLLLFRMGDFYELFFEDAVIASQILNITLTHRGKIADHPIPMAGIPHHAAGNYIDRITRLGRKAVICDQIEDPKMAQGLVKRAVTQIVSPCLPFDLDKTSAGERHFIAAGTVHADKFYITLLDFTTGDFLGINVDSEKDFLETLNLYSPKEFLSSLGQWEEYPLIQACLQQEHFLTTYLSQEFFSAEHHTHVIEKLIPHFRRDAIIQMHPFILSPISALSYYIHSTRNLEKLYHIKPFRFTKDKELLRVSYSSLMGLEILPRNEKNYHNSLMGHMDYTKSALGRRAFKKLFETPSLDQKLIENRQKVVEILYQSKNILDEIRLELSHVLDVERILAKLSTGKCAPSDSLNLAKTILAFFSTQKYLEPIKSSIPKDVFPHFTKEELLTLKKLAEKIKDTINSELGASFEKGNLICAGVSPERDRLAKLSHHSHQELIELENKYRTLTQITTLKIRSNNISGYYVEIPRSQMAKIPSSFQRKQTLVNNERYTTDELSNYEHEVVLAGQKLQKIEQEIFEDILNDIKGSDTLLQKTSLYLSLLDVFASLSFVAWQEQWVKPQIESKQIFDVVESWHPLIKKQIKDLFVPHSITLNQKQNFILITGPNMAGKTTVMREVAIIQFLTHIGSFVPAKSARVSLCDYLFSRLGASDDITQGHSTFMVEMAETAEILRHATPQSLIILDEIGRGTSTYDGLSIAWALVEYITKNIKAFTLFATHYHELIEVVDEIPHAKNFTVETISTNDDVKFLYRFIEGGATQSFGIHVAKLAGLPHELLNRAKEILPLLEHHGFSNNSYQEKISAINKYPLEEELRNLNINSLTPLEALNKLQELQKATQKWEL